MDDKEINFIDAIKKDPNNDTLRLIFADWLEERADARSDLIRYQVEAARLPENTPERLSLEGKAEKIIEMNRDTWEAPLREFGVQSVTYDRGLPMVTMTAQAFLDNAKQLFALVPSIMGLQIKKLHVYDEPEELASDQLQALASSPYLQNLTHLKLSYNGAYKGPDGSGLWALAASPNLTHLTHLDLKSCGMGVVEVKHLVASPSLRHLTNLNLYDNYLGDAGVAELAASPHLQHLTQLNLGQNNIGEAGVHALANGPQLTRLNGLNLKLNDEIGKGGARALIRSPYLQQLTDLKLPYNGRIGDALLEQIERDITARTEKALGATRRGV